MDKESWTLWFTGLHGSGKTTIAARIYEILKSKGLDVELLDGDELRKIKSADLGYSIEDRNLHMQRVADHCKKLSSEGIISIACVASPTEKSRSYAKDLLKKIVIVYVKCTLKTCQKRDVKGHYKKARLGEKGFENFLGVTLKYEEPDDPDIILDTENESIGDSVNRLLEHIKHLRIV